MLLNIPVLKTLIPGSEEHLLKVFLVVLSPEAPSQLVLLWGQL
jgi:hypothetical protein